jgi:hypothetical protein
MSDTIVYTILTVTKEFNSAERLFASTTKEGLIECVRSAWHDYNSSKVSAIVVDMEKETRRILSGLTPVERLCITSCKGLI